MENQFVIPIEILQRIESWLIADIGYDRPMFEEEFAEITYRLDSEEESELYLNLTYEDEPELKGDIYEDALTIGKNLVIPIYPIASQGSFTMSEEGIKDIWNKHIKSPSENDKDVYYALLILSAIYYKHKATKGFFGFEPSSGFETPSSPKKRKEMLELYVLLNEESKTNKKTVEIRYNNNSTLLRNQDGWFTEMMSKYFAEYLILNGVEDAKRELSNFDLNYSTAKGRPADITYNSLLIATYSLVKHLSVASQKNLSNSEAEFMLDYIKYLGEIEPDGKRDDIQNLRSTITLLQKNNQKPQWWNSALFL